jgi:hypothetical protein
MIRPAIPARRRHSFLGWMLLILLAASVFRFTALLDAPPGLTHDEADHGLTAMGILDGARDIYFTIGYGREPLYDYAAAGVMGLIGRGVLAGRLTSAYFSLLLVALVAAWARRAFGVPVALLAAAGLAAGFWPVMAGRQMLRSITLPALFAGAVLLFWTAMEKLAPVTGRKFAGDAAPAGRSPWPLVVLSGLFLGLTAYTYIPARVLWLVFPALVAFLALAGRSWQWPLWRALGLALLVAALVAMPLAAYLHLNPGLEVRVGELSAPLRAVAAGDAGPLLDNALGSLRLFTVEGDATWRYNLAGRPWLRPLTGALFYAGLLTAAWLALRGLRRREPGPGPAAGALVSLVWLLLGLSPVLVTGPGLSMTQAIGALPVLYVFPALAAVALFDGAARLARQRGVSERAVQLGGTVAAVVLVSAGAFLTAREYFSLWAPHPEVRVQYEAATIAALEYLKAHETGPAAVSTIAPGPFHSPAVAALLLGDRAAGVRFFDGRQSLLLPAMAGAPLILPGFTPPAPALMPYWAVAAPAGEVPLPATDIDRPLRLFRVDGTAAAEFAAAHMTAGPAFPARFGASLELLGYDLQTPVVRPGETVRLVTAWRLLSPLPDAALFAHLTGGPGAPLAQADALGAPGSGWQAGDVLFQLHEFAVPDNAAPGAYPLTVGVYRTTDGARLTTRGLDALPLAEVVVE